MPGRFGGPGQANTLGALTSNRFSLQAGGVYVPPSNWYNYAMGRYTQAQTFDPIGQIWSPVSGPIATGGTMYFDGTNQRFANTSGCAVGALLTASGAGYTSAPVVTPSAGGSMWTAVMGQVVSTTVAVTYGGSNYTYAPNVLFQVPNSPGIAAAGYATISGGVVTSITITNQGAGYLYPPQIVLVNDPRDTTGAGATATATLTGLGGVTAVLCNNHGTPLTSVPTLSFSGGGGTGAAATAVMNFALTGYTVTTAGAGYTAAAGNVTVSATPTPTAGAAAFTNTSSQIGVVRQRPAIILAPASGSGAITATGLLVIDGGSYEAVPATGSVTILGGTGIVTTAAVLALTVGGLNDNDLYIYPG
jgi:hypothetical protein